MWNHHHHHGGGGGGWGGGGWSGSRGGGWGGGCHPHYYGGGGGSAWPFIGGMMLGGAVANINQPSRTYVYEQPPPVYTAPQSTIDYQARADAQEAKRSAEEALARSVNSSSASPSQNILPDVPPGFALIKVRVPEGVQSGQLFTFNIQGKSYSVTCPSNVTAGQETYTYIPLNNGAAPGYAQVSENKDLASRGHALFNQALASSPRRVVLLDDHVVDEMAPSNSEHNIIAGHKGDVVELLEGTVEGGLSPPYQEYCLVRFADGRSGKVSKYILAYDSPRASTLPPPAKHLESY